MNFNSMAAGGLNGPDLLAQLQGLNGAFLPSMMGSGGMPAPAVTPGFELPGITGYAPPMGGAAPAGGVMPNWGGGQKLGLNMGTANLALSGLQTIAGLYGAFKAASLANKQFKFTKEVTNTNLNNQIKSYNTALEDRARSRAVVEGQSPEQTNDYLNRNRATRG